MSWLETPGDFDAHTLSEFFEAELLISGDDYFSAAELRALFPSGRQPTETDIEVALAEIERRGTTMGRLYPFAVVDRGILLDRQDYSSLYAALLLLSLRGTPVRVERDYPRSDPIFDEVARVAFKNSFGPAAEALVFAWPPRGERPPTFPAAVAWVAGRIGLTLRGGYIPEEPRDAGVDVIVWRPYPDGRNGFMMLLAQNTIQFAFRKKPRDVQPSQWRDWLEIGSAPNVGFAVPFLIPHDDIWWDAVVVDVHIVLDRGRLLHELRSEEPTGWPSWGSIETFVGSEITQYKDGGGTLAGVPALRKKRQRE